jgi:hypothetical protein
MEAIELISQDLFDKVRSRYSNLEMGDEDGNITTDPRKARFFDFNFTMEGNDLGRVSISINERGSLKIFYGQGILEGHDLFTQNIWFSFLKEMRLFAKRRLLRFDTRDITKSNLDKSDFQYLASSGTKEENMAESRMYGSKYSSYLPMERTKLVIRHKKDRPVDETQRGGRSRNIAAIFIENSEGERFKYPFIHLPGAKAMQRHVANGGRPHDNHGQAIIRMSEEIAQLNSFKRHISLHDSMHSDANTIIDRANSRLESLRHQVHSLSKQSHYKEWVESRKDPEDDGSLIIDQATMEDYKNKFTVNTFSEELTQFFPLLHRIMKETSVVDLDEYVKETEETTCKECGMLESSCECEHEKEIKEFSEFSNWAERITEDHLPDDILNNLKDLIGKNLKVGVDGTNGIESLKGIGLEDEDLEDLVKQAGPDGDLKTVITLWLNDKNDTKALDMLGLNSPTQEPTEEPADGEETPPAPAPLAPPPAAPAPSAAPSAAPPVPPGAPPLPTPTSEGTKPPKDLREKNLKNVVEMIKSFYNKEEGNFPIGEHGVITKVRKQFGDYAATLAERLINQVRIPNDQNLKTSFEGRNRDQKTLEDIIRLSGIKK